jgi:opacity protein-like surface antigen
MATRCRIASALAAMALSMGFGGGAEAADMALRGSLPAYESNNLNWGGLYGGIHGGIGATTFDAQSAARAEATRLLTGLTFLNTTTGTPAPEFIQIDPIRSAPKTFGLFLGYQTQFEDAVLGVELDYSRVGSGSGGTRNWASPYSVLYPSIGFTDSFSQSATVSVNLRDIFTARVRGGWAFGRIMPYVTGGLVIARGDTSVTYVAGYSRIDTDPADGTDWTQGYTVISPTPPANTRAQRGVLGFGFTGGTGIEALITNNLFVRGEYNYVRIPSLGGVGVTMHTVRAGIGVKY